MTKIGLPETPVHIIVEQAAKKRVLRVNHMKLLTITKTIKSNGNK